MNRKQAYAQQKRKTVAKRVAVVIRMPEDIVAQIDRELEGRTVPLSRNNWLLEAAIEKLKRNGGGGRNGSE